METELKRIRSDLRSFKGFIESFYSDRRARKAILEVLNDSIRCIHQVEPSSWGITVYRDHIRLNVGGVEAITLSANSIGLLVTGKLFNKLPLRTRRKTVYRQSYRFVKDIKLIEGPIHDGHLIRSLKASHVDAILRSARHRRKYFWPHAHSKAVILYSNSVGIDMPDPDYSFFKDSKGKKSNPQDLDLTDKLTVEGRRALRQHLIIERKFNPSRKKKSVLQKTGKLACEVCDFDFEAFYGPIGADFAEVHHLIPLAISGVTKIGLQNLAIVCSNCHRMLHRGNPVFTIKELKRRIKVSSK